MLDNDCLQCNMQDGWTCREYTGPIAPVGLSPRSLLAWQRDTWGDEELGLAPRSSHKRPRLAGIAKATAAIEKGIAVCGRLEEPTAKR